MNNELNSYNIKNHDGADKTKYNEGKISFDNDNIRFIKENAPSVSESARVGETFDDRKQKSSRASSRDVGSNNGSGGNTQTSSTGSSAGSSVGSSATSAASSTAASATSAATSAASAISGSIGALAGTVAASVAAAVMVVAAFVSTLTINVSLLLAGMNSLVFQVELNGAQEEDFINPIVAVLEDDGGGVLGEQEIRPDNLLLYYYDLQPGKEYLLTIKNEEKIFVKKSFFTATEEKEKGRVFALQENSEICVVVEHAEIKKGEYYTLTVKDEKGKVVFAKDGTEETAEYRFTIYKTQSLYITLSVNGATYAVTQINATAEPEPQPDYDYSAARWEWDEIKFSYAYMVVPDRKGFDPLRLNARIGEPQVATRPTCESSGEVLYTATVTANGTEYTDTKTKELPIIDHEYEFIEKSVDEDGQVGVYEHYECSICHKCFDEDHNEINESELYVLLEYDYDKEEWEWAEDLSWANVVFPELNGFDPLKVQADLRPYTTEPTTEQDGSKVVTAVAEYNGKTYKDSQIVVLPRIEPEYDFDNPEWNWEIDEGTGEYTGNATLSFNEIHGGKPLTELASVQSQSSEPTCESSGEVLYTATVTVNGTEYSDTLLIELPLGHAYGELIPKNYEGNGLKAHYHCETCDSYFDEEYVKTTLEDLALVLVELNIGNGNIILYADGYEQNGVFTAFENTENSRYIISGYREADTPLKFISRTKSGANVETVEYYVDFNNAEILGDSGAWATALIINPFSNTNIYMANVGTGTTTIKGYNHVAFSVQNANEHVNIYIESENGFDSFVCGDRYKGTSQLYKEKDNISVYMNGAAVDSYGNNI